jgi:predicted metal-dependent hydrolase
MNPSSTSIAWPPQYKVKKHRLARHVKLKAVSANSLEITIPCRFNQREIPAILEEHKSWIIRQLSRLPPLSQTQEMPDAIHFNAINEFWNVYYMECDARLKIIQRPNREIVLVGKVGDQNLCREKLIQWVKNKSRAFLESQLHAISTKTSLPYKSVAIRDQQTVWGSCTAAKSISLNYKLMFLPQHLAHYVIIHELCHTRHLNHSQDFWNLVAVHDPDWRKHRYELRHANQYIPAWIQTE